MVATTRKNCDRYSYGKPLTFLKRLQHKRAPFFHTHTHTHAYIQHLALAVAPTAHNTKAHKIHSNETQQRNSTPHNPAAVPACTYMYTPTYISCSTRAQKKWCKTNTPQQNAPTVDEPLTHRPCTHPCHKPTKSPDNTHHLCTTSLSLVHVHKSIPLFCVAHTPIPPPLSSTPPLSFTPHQATWCRP